MIDVHSLEYIVKGHIVAIVQFLDFIAHVFVEFLGIDFQSTLGKDNEKKIVETHSIACITRSSRKRNFTRRVGMRPLRPVSIMFHTVWK